MNFDCFRASPQASRACVRDALEFFHQPRRNFRFAIVAAPPFADVRRLVRAGREAVLLAFGNPVANLRRGEQPVRLAAQPRQLLRAMVQRLGGHVSFLVPRQALAGAVQQGDFRARLSSLR